MELKQYQLWQPTPMGLGKEYFYVYSTESFERYLTEHNIKYNLYKKYNLFEEQRKEIERLNRQYKMLEELNNANYESFIEANKVINELEKWLKEKQELTCGCGITQDYLYAYELCLEELQELKGDNSNENK